MTARTTAGRFQPGQSGNPKGQKPGSRLGPAARIRAAIDKHSPAIIKTLIEAAKAGDIQAATALLDRIAPKLRSEAAPSNINLDDDPALVKARILLAVSDGQIAAETGAELLALVQRATPPESAVKPVDYAALDALYEKAMAKAEADRLIYRDRIARPEAEVVNEH